MKFEPCFQLQVISSFIGCCISLFWLSRATNMYCTSILYMFHWNNPVGFHVSLLSLACFTSFLPSACLLFCLRDIPLLKFWCVCMHSDLFLPRCSHQISLKSKFTFHCSYFVQCTIHVYEFYLAYPPLLSAFSFGQSCVQRDTFTYAHCFFFM